MCDVSDFGILPAGRMKTKKFKHCVIIGIGLMGASMARALKKRSLAHEIVGFDHNQKNLRLAKKNKFIDRVAKNLHDELQNADLVVMSVPVFAILGLLKQVADLAKPTALVIDLGSTKVSLVSAADELFLHGNFVGCHPVAGGSAAGPIASQADLFSGKPCFVTPGKRTKSWANASAQKLWRDLGASVITTSAVFHDKGVAATSHLPHVLSFVLIDSVAGAHPKKMIQTIAGASFKALARLASSNPKIWADIFLDNSLYVLEEIRRVKKNLSLIEKLIKKQKRQPLFDYLARVSRL